MMKNGSFLLSYNFLQKQWEALIRLACRELSTGKNGASYKTKVGSRGTSRGTRINTGFLLSYFPTLLRRGGAVESSSTCRTI